jgi:hypothetical protein
VGKKARIIQACLDSKGFIICKSALYNFSTIEERKSNINLFLLYMASEPTGNTKDLNFYKKTRRMMSKPYYITKYWMCIGKYKMDNR